MWRKIAINILRYRQYFVIGLIVWTIAIVAILLTSHLQFTRNNAQLLPDDDVNAINLKTFSKSFGSEENIMFLGVYEKNLRSEEDFQKWVELRDQIKKEIGVKDVISVGQAVKLLKDTVNQSFISEPIAPDIRTRADFDKALLEIKELPFYKDVLYNEETSALQSMIYLDSKLINTQAREQIVFDIQKLVDAYSAENDIKVYTSGMPLIRTMNAKEVKSESFLFIFLSLLVTCFIFTLIFRSFKATFTVVLIIILAVLSSFATMAVLGYEITLLTALVPPLMIVIGVPNCIFLLNKYFQEYQKHQNKAKALVRTIMKIGNATFLTNFTTAFGFLTFIFTNSETLRQFGLVASINIMLVFFYSLLIIPIAFSYFKAPTKFSQGISDTPFMLWFNKQLKYIVTEKRKWVFGTTVVLLLLSVLGMTLMTKSSNMLDDMSKDAQYYKDVSFFDSNFGGILPVEIVVEGAPNSAMQLGTLRKVKRLYSSLDSIPSLGRPISLVDGVEYANQAFYNGSPEFYQLPSNYEKAFVFNYIKNSKGEKNMLDRYVNSNGSQLRISAVMRNEDSDELEKSFAEIQADLKDIFKQPNQNAFLTGIAFVHMKGTDYLSENLGVSLALAILVIAMLMAFMFRSLKMIVISLIPNFLPLLVTAGFMGYFQIPIKPSTILVFSIAFGIAVDDTIHYLAKYRQEMHIFPDIKTGVLKALKETSNSMFYSSVVLFAGFSTFLLSGFQGIQALGGLISITLFFAVFSNLILLPSLLLQFKGSTDKEFVFPDVDYFKESLSDKIEDDLEEDQLAEEIK